MLKRWGPLLTWIVGTMTIRWAVTTFKVGALTASQTRPRQPQAQQLQLLQQASRLSNAAAHNITAAQEACQLWDQILTTNGPSLSAQVRGIGFLLHASCLVRVGRDEEAIESFERAECEDMDVETKDRIVVGKASSLQRLLRYRQAFECFGNASSSAAIQGAFVCALRLGDTKLAHQVMKVNQEAVERDPNVAALWYILTWLDSNSNGDSKTSISHDIQRSSLKQSTLGQWVLSLDSTNVMEWKTNSSPFDLALVNIGPFDDPLVQCMDDKVELHGLLQGFDFWPHGYILPKEAFRLEKEPSNSWWMKKKRAGYGSHGNQIVHMDQIVSEPAAEEPFLLQQLIDPTYLLPDGRKFSLRVYVIYFLPLENSKEYTVYLTRDGLVKVAGVPHNASSFPVTEEMFMTNSGRGMETRQETFQFLQEVMGKQGDSFDDLWQGITHAVSDTMEVFLKHAYSQSQKDPSLMAYRESLGRLAIPKVLGFDFLVDEQLRPWLLEVNRFPGLEPRNDVDRAVKETVLSNAWLASKQRVKGVNVDSFDTLFRFHVDGSRES